MKLWVDCNNENSLWNILGQSTLRQSPYETDMPILCLLFRLGHIKNED